MLRATHHLRDVHRLWRRTCGGNDWFCTCNTRPAVHPDGAATTTTGVQVFLKEAEWGWGDTHVSNTEHVFQGSGSIRHGRHVRYHFLHHQDGGRRVDARACKGRQCSRCQSLETFHDDALAKHKRAHTEVICNQAHTYEEVRTGGREEEVRKIPNKLTAHMSNRIQ